MKKILKWSSMFSAMVQNKGIRRRTGVRRYISWKNLSKVHRLLVVQYLESSSSNFKINFLANREPVQAGQNWLDVAVPRFLCNNSSKGVLNQRNASKIRCERACKNKTAIVEPRADYCHDGYCFCCFSGQG